MSQSEPVNGFSKLSRLRKVHWLRDTFDLDEADFENLQKHVHSDSVLQELYEEFSENTVSNFFIPYGLAPNFLINGKWFVVPFAIEESSVVAAASHAAKFWSKLGGFKAEVIDTLKTGQVHFSWSGEPAFISQLFEQHKDSLVKSLDETTASMRKRGGGITSIELRDKTSELRNYYQLFVQFRTANAMGANFINTVLEALAEEWKTRVEKEKGMAGKDGALDIDMAILSNYTPESLVRVHVETPVGNLGGFDQNLSGKAFAEKFVRAVAIARTDPYRAVTHNKGIFNGMDGVVIATGNDFRAVESCGHAYASRSGQYRGLSMARLDNGTFYFELEIPMALGTVGGLTSGHPLAKTSLKILQNPSAEELMMITAAAGLANNFSAVRSLITSGIQKGHMKMHLTNILRQLGAGEAQKKAAVEFFKDKTVSHAAVKSFLDTNE